MKQIDEKLKRQKAIDDWLPISSSRNAKWWYSAFHNVTAMVGAGVLSLPSAMASLGWYTTNTIYATVLVFFTNQHRLGYRLTYSLITKSHECN